MTGRPTIFSIELADRICERLVEGESLRSICKDDDMPSVGTVCRWLADDAHPGFREQYARAREAQADTIFDEQLDIADDASNDWMERFDKDGQSLGWVLNGEHVQRSKLRIDTRKWMAAKLAPKRYGDKVALTGEDGGPIKHQHTIDPGKLSDEALKEIAALGSPDAS